MSHRKNAVVLSFASEEKMSYALYIVKDIEQQVKSIVFQNNVEVLNFGGSHSTIPLPASTPFTLISKNELDNLNSEINCLKVN